MTADLKPYPAMKDSGVPWLGKVPEHWEVRRLKRLCSRSALYGANVAAYTSIHGNGCPLSSHDGLSRRTDTSRGEASLSLRSWCTTTCSQMATCSFSRSGTIGRSFLYDSSTHGPCAYAGYLVRFVPTSAVLPRYVLLFTKTQAFAGFLQVVAISLHD